MEHRIHRKDGTVRWVLRFAFPQFDNQDRLIAYDGLLRDITERKRAEWELARLAAIVQSSNDAITINCWGFHHCTRH